MKKDAAAAEEARSQEHVAEESPPSEDLEAKDLPARDADDIAATGAATEIEEGVSAVEVVEEEAEEEPSDAALIEQLREELAAAQAQVEMTEDKLKRAAADFQNIRRRQERHLSDAIERANADLIRQLLPILDDLELAFENAPGSDAEDEDVEADEAEDEGTEQAWIAGFRQIQKKLLDLLQEQGVSKIDASGPFDPSLHEAVVSEPNDEVESGHIIGVLRTGYEFKGQVLRPSMVRVAA